MTREKKIKEFEENIKEGHFDKTVLNDRKKALHQEWEEIKSDEDTLAVAIKVTKRDENQKATEIFSPIVSSLILLDYDKVEPLIYQTLINIIYNNPTICRLYNPFSNERNYTFLISSLFNENLFLTDNQKKFLLEEALHTNLEIEKIFEKLKRNCMYEYINDEYNHYINLLKAKIEEQNPHLLSKPTDIRYFIYNHKMFKDLNNDEKWRAYYEKLFILKNFFTIPNHEWLLELKELQDAFIKKEIQDYNNFNILLEDSVERINIRKLTRMPF